MVEEVRLLEAEPELDLAELRRLEARRRAEHVAEFEIVDRRQRRQHVPRQGHHRLDAADPRHRLIGFGEAVLPRPARIAKRSSWSICFIHSSLVWWMTMNSISSWRSDSGCWAPQQLVELRDSRHRSCRRASRS